MNAELKPTLQVAMDRVIAFVKANKTLVAVFVAGIVIGFVLA
jgi:hypothetical protein